MENLSINIQITNRELALMLLFDKQVLVQELNGKETFSQKYSYGELFLLTYYDFNTLEGECILIEE